MSTIQKVQKLQTLIYRYQVEIKRIQDNCIHTVLPLNDDKESLIAPCPKCDYNFGYQWYCPKSTDGFCVYKQADGSYNGDNCVFCHQPEERK